jgi:hypothetical protein
MKEAMQRDVLSKIASKMLKEGAADSRFGKVMMPVERYEMPSNPLELR